MIRENLKQETIQSTDRTAFDTACNDLRKKFEVIAEQSTMLYTDTGIVYIAVLFYNDKPK